MTNKLRKLRDLVSKGKKANQDSWHVVGLPWNNHTPYINAKFEDPHIGRAIIDAVEPDFFEGENDEDIARQEEELKAEMYANMQFITAAANCREEIEALLDERDRYREALEFIRIHIVNNTEPDIDYLHDTAKQALKEKHDD